MKQIFAICSFEILRVFKNKKSWLLMFLMPILFTLVFGGMGGGEIEKTPVAVVDLDNSVLSQEFTERLVQDELIAPTPMTTEEAAALLHDKKTSAIITLPQGYEQQAASGQAVHVAFQHGPDLGTAPTLRQSLDDIAARQAVQLTAALAHSERTGVVWQDTYRQLAASDGQAVKVVASVVTQNQATKKLSGTGSTTIGFSIMFLMISLMSTTGSILEARKMGVWYRMMSTPVSRMQILIGYLLSFFLIGWIQFGIMMALSTVLFGTAWGNPLGQVVLVSALLLCVVGLGLFIAGFVRSTEQQSAISSIVIISTCMLGGVYWPLDIVSDTMRKIADFVPQKWAMEGFTELVARGGSVGDIVTPVLILLAFAAVFLTAGISRIRYES